MKHTPGEWKVVSHYVIVDNMDRGGVIAKLTGDRPIQWACEKGHEEIPANAHLIAAAPELYEACKAIQYFGDGPCGKLIPNDLKIRLKRAISKAEWLKD